MELNGKTLEEVLNTGTIMKRVDETVINDMLDKGILVPGKYLITENCLTVTADLHDKVSTYLRDNGFWPTGIGSFYNGECQQWTFWINRE